MTSKKFLLAGLLPALISASASAQSAAPTWQEPHTGMEFIPVAASCFAMGLPEQAFRGEGDVFLARLRSEMPQHKVCLDKFWIGKFEVTEEQWLKVMGQPRSTRGGELPVTRMSWQEANDFARRLTELSGPGVRYRLPTEAEWEYACRAGSTPITNILPGGDPLADKAWFSYHYDMSTSMRHKAPHPVGTRKPNDYGAYDMLGNAWEWVQDSYRADAYAQHTAANPVIDNGDTKRVIRGGSFRTSRHFVRCEARSWYEEAETNDSVGFRLVRIQQGDH